MKVTDLIGKKFNRWTVVSRSYNSGEQTYWNCICDCGSEKRVNSATLKNGNSKSCGCLIREITSNIFSTHKDTKSKEYNAWNKIKERCYQPGCSQYPNYGGRGIKVCDRWLHSYENFLDDMGRAPSPTHSIDRKDNNGNYGPDNCRWSTSLEQANNKRNNRYFTIDGVTLTLSQWCVKTGINASTANNRLYKKGWDIERVLVPVIKKAKVEIRPKAQKVQE